MSDQSSSQRQNGDSSGRPHHLMAVPEGFICPECIGFKVTWAYSWMLQDSWRQMV